MPVSGFACRVQKAGGELQPVLDKAASKLSPWKGRLLNRPGRLVLINSVVTATATYFLTAPPSPLGWQLGEFLEGPFVGRERSLFFGAGNLQAGTVQEVTGQRCSA